MPRFRPEIRQDLINLWLPRLERMKADRRLSTAAMASCLGLLVIAGGSVFVMAIVEGSLVAAGTAGSFCVGLVSVAIVYLGKIQACRDAVEGIAGAIIADNADQLWKQIGQLSCLGRFRGLLNDTARIVQRSDGDDKGG